MIYDVNLVNKYGQLEHVSAYGVDRISKSKGNQDASKLRKYFPDLPKKIFDPLPPREVEMLIGTNYSGLHPGGPADRRRGHVRIQESLFGSGWVISGSDVEIGASSSELTSAARQLSVNKLQVTPVAKKMTPGQKAKQKESLRKKEAQDKEKREALEKEKLARKGALAKEKEEKKRLKLEEKTRKEHQKEVQKRAKEVERMEKERLKKEEDQEKEEERLKMKADQRKAKREAKKKAKEAAEAAAEREMPEIDPSYGCAADDDPDNPSNYTEPEEGANKNVL